MSTQKPPFQVLSLALATAFLFSAPAQAEQYRLQTGVSELKVIDSKWEVPIDGEPTKPNPGEGESPKPPVPEPVPPVLLSVDRTRADFGLRQVGQSGGGAVFRLVNNSSSTIAVDGVKSGESQNFTYIHNCNELVPSASCDVTAYFNPQAEGALSLNMGVSHSGENPLVLTVQGTGVLPVLELSSDDKFGDVSVGSTREIIAKLKNAGIGPLSLSTPFTSGSTDFKLVEHNCPSLLASQAQCQLVLSLTPTAASPMTGTLTIVSSAGERQLRLNGVGRASALRLTGGVGALGSSEVGQPKTSSLITLSNIGNSPASGLRLASTNPVFTLSEVSCTNALGAGESCTLKVTFTPPGTGLQKGELWVLNEDGSLAASAALRATGTNSAMTLLSSAIFSYSTVGVPVSFNYKFFNGSSQPIRILSARPWASTSNVSVVNGKSTCPDPVPAQTSCLLGVVGTSTDNEPASTQVTLEIDTSAGAMSGAYRLENSWAKLSFNAAGNSPLNFAGVPLGTSVRSSSIRMNNAARSSFQSINELAMSLPDGFKLVDSTCGSTLSRAAYCEFKVEFTPTQAKPYGGTLAFTTSHPATGATPHTATIAVTGSGQSPATLGWQGLSLGNVERGHLETKRVYLYNDSTSPATVSSLALEGQGLSLGSSSCSGTIPAKGTCFADVRIQSNVEGLISGTISASLNEMVTAGTLTGKVANAVLTMSPTSLTGSNVYQYGSGTVDAWKQLTVTVRNTGSVTANNLTRSESQTAGELAKLTINTENLACGNTLPAGASCTYALRFYSSSTISGPTSATGTAKVTSTSTSVSVPFSFGFVPVGPRFVPEAELEDVEVGGISRLKFNVKNDPYYALLPQTPVLSGNKTDYYLTGASNCGTSLEKNASCSVEIAFSPTAQGPRPPATLTLQLGPNKTVTTFTNSGL